jgi:hypothetical protein
MDTKEVTIELDGKPLDQIHKEILQVAGPEVAAQVTMYSAFLRAADAIGGLIPQSS